MWNFSYNGVQESSYALIDQSGTPIKQSLRYKGTAGSGNLYAHSICNTILKNSAWSQNSQRKH